MRPDVIFVDDELHVRRSAGQMFEIADISHLCVGSAQEALGALDPTHPGILVTDLRMPKVDGVQLLHEALLVDPDLPVILITGHGDIDTAVQCMKDGAFDFIRKPFDPPELVELIRRALERRKLIMQMRTIRSELDEADIVATRLPGQSSVAQRLRRQVRGAARAKIPLHLAGPPGVGKTHIARMVHDLGHQADMPFRKVDCGALPPGSLHDLLRDTAPGGGTVYLADIVSLCDADLHQLLHDYPTSTAIGRLLIGSTDDDDSFLQHTSEGRRLVRTLNPFRIDVPALDRRRDDIPVLFEMFVAEAAKTHQQPEPAVPGALLAALAFADWPENLRSLQAAARAFVLEPDTGLSQLLGRGASLPDRMAAHEKDLIAATIAAHGGRIKPVYETLGLSRRALYDKMQKHGLHRGDFVKRAGK